MAQAADIPRSNAGPPLAPLGFDDLPGFEDDDFLAAFAVWRHSALAILEGRPTARPGLAASPACQEIARAGLAIEASSQAQARRFFVSHFRPYRVLPSDESPAGFVTGYFEPLLRGALAPSAEFPEPVLSRPDDLVSFRPGEAPAGLDPGLAGARAGPDGALAPYPDRAGIEAAAAAGRATPILWLEDAVELFVAQVQGSARVALPDGRQLRLAYDGRNGQPYTSIGRLLIEAGEIAEKDMSLLALKGWLRAHGLKPGEAGRALMQKNRSYVFFKIEERFNPEAGPLGGQGIPLTPLRSIAVDRTVWPYGAPFWIDAALPWRDAAPSYLRRLMIAQDVGSAIVGPARADIFFGSGDEAGRRAGDIRHRADIVVLLPRGAHP